MARTKPRLQLPPGYMQVENHDGSISIVKSGERLDHTMAFRLSHNEYFELLPFFEVFEGQQSSALRWLLSQPLVKEMMAKEIAARS